MKRFRASAEQITRVRELHMAGFALTRIANMTDLSLKTVFRIVHKLGAYQ